ncbi:hypothetical protein J1P26_20025 [Neobacillus sp. MM2021_6]|uniref:hypothetical protein n=1 Tax=Bacillaceae TaxID=186817 RepID=UPI0014074850|nr:MULTISPECIES: hypothetical protein [Bacillaceae]MBO0961997.1 hypothetical protein [Neobacillus sp. MM2021_6]NHC20307.1 hypothetical protein [Bacillus sp. MM2020_4]
MEVKFENGLLVKSIKSAVILEADLSHSEIFNFNSTEFEEFTMCIQQMAKVSWKNIVPKEEQSEASDYWEYYDKELDNNGYLTLGTGHLSIRRPCSENKRIYQFNKRKMESFLYDLQKEMTV